MARVFNGLRPARSLREWAVRGGLAATALTLGYISTKQTLALSLLKTNANQAYTLSPGDGRIAGALAHQLVSRADRRILTDSLAHRALVAEPLAVTAITSLGLNAQITGDYETAKRLFTHSNALSRRELGTRMWMIEDAVTRGDIPAALRHYDIALRTAKAAPDLLFPVLSEAIADPAIAKALALTLSAQPPWYESFIGYLGASSSDPALTARFFQYLGEHGLPVPEVPQIGVVNQLAASGLLEQAWSSYSFLRKNIDRRRSRDRDFTAQLLTPAVFDWIPVTNQTGVSASLDSGSFNFAAASTAGGSVLEQMQLFPAGRYRLEGVSSGIDQPPTTRPYWQLTCRDGREVGRLTLPNSDENGGRFMKLFVVPASCDAQVLRLVIRPSPEIGGVSGAIENVGMGPAEGDR